MPSQHPHVLERLNNFKANIAEERRIGGASWTELFTDGKLRNPSRVLLGAGPYMLNQWSGIISLAHFLPSPSSGPSAFSTAESDLAGELGVQ